MSVHYDREWINEVNRDLLGFRPGAIVQLLDSTLTVVGETHVNEDGTIEPWTNDGKNSGWRTIYRVISPTGGSFDFRHTTVRPGDTLFIRLGDP